MLNYVAKFKIFKKHRSFSYFHVLFLRSSAMPTLHYFLLKTWGGWLSFGMQRIHFFWYHIICTCIERNTIMRCWYWLVRTFTPFAIVLIAAVFLMILSTYNISIFINNFSSKKCNFLRNLHGNQQKSNLTGLFVFFWGGGGRANFISWILNDDGRDCLLGTVKICFGK